MNNREDVRTKRDRLWFIFIGVAMSVLLYVPCTFANPPGGQSEEMINPAPRGHGGPGSVQEGPGHGRVERRPDHGNPYPGNSERHGGAADEGGRSDQNYESSGKGPSIHPGGSFARNGESRSSYTIGKRLPILPPGIAAMRVADALFYYHLGMFFRPVPGGGYVVVGAPVGARIRTLPEECTVVYSPPHRYYYCHDTYYQHRGDYYVVVSEPNRGSTKSEIVMGDEIQVTADVLNIRTGPGKRFRVIGQLYRGDVAIVSDKDKHWYYVTLKDNSTGWILSRYTRYYRSRPKG